MLCPNCGQQMNVRNVDNEIVLHCATCGSSFFDKDGINKITQNSARILTDEAQGQYVLGNQKLCPKDKSILLEKVDGSLPKNTILLECPSCEGIFAYPDDLLKYKGVKAASPLASGAFKLLPAPKSLFMLASFAVLTVAVLLNTGSFSTNTKASNVMGTVTMSAKNSTLSISFLSEHDGPVAVIYYDSKGIETRRITIASTGKTSSDRYAFTILDRDFDQQNDVTYKMVFPGEDETKITRSDIQL